MSSSDIQAAPSEWLLFDTSPFLFRLAQANIDHVADKINIQKLIPLLAIAHEIAICGTEINRLHIDNYEFLRYSYGVKASDLVAFLFGFTTPPTLVIGGFLVATKPMEIALKRICRESDNPIEIAVNQYKALHLVAIGEIYTALSGRPPDQYFLAVYDYCRRHPLERDFFITGLEASRRLSSDLFQYLTFEPRPSP